MSILFVDTETTGLKAPTMVSIAWILTYDTGEILQEEHHIIRPNGWTIPVEASNIHGITTDAAMDIGKPLSYVMDLFTRDFMRAGVIVAHNMVFDLNVIDRALISLGRTPLSQTGRKFLCTMRYAQRSGPCTKFNLNNLYMYAFNSSPPYPLHDALGDTLTLKDIVFKLWKYRDLLAASYTLPNEGEDKSPTTLVLDISEAIVAV